MSSRAASFVIFPIGEHRFALRAEQVTELARPGKLQQFPHTTRLLTGVLVKRGHIVPVCDVATSLVGPDAPPRRFYLIATRPAKHDEWTAIPVTGECELIVAEMTPATGSPRNYVVGQVSRGTDQVPVIDLEKLIETEAAA